MKNAEHASANVPCWAGGDFGPHANTPWGVSQGATVYSDGVVLHLAAGHGGFHLDAARNAKVPPALREPDGWYEEDCAWAAVAQAFPELFTEYEWRCADRTIRDWVSRRLGGHSRPSPSTGRFAQEGSARLR